MDRRQVVIDFSAHSAHAQWLRSLLRSGIAEVFDADIHYWPTEPPSLTAALVVDDGGDAGLAALRWALKLRTLHPTLDIAVLRALPHHHDEAAGLALAISDPVCCEGGRQVETERLTSLLNADAVADNHLSLRMDSSVITFEYQGCQ